MRNISYFIDDISRSTLNSVPLISEAEFIKEIKGYLEEVRAYIAIGNSNIRQAIVDKFANYANLIYPNLISNSVTGDFCNIRLGSGNILFPNVVLTTDIVVGDHNHFNLSTTISHDCRIGNYNTFSPGVRIAGSVSMGNHNFFGVGACVVDKVTIADNIIVGAGAVVTCDLIKTGTYVGVPAKQIK